MVRANFIMNFTFNLFLIGFVFVFVWWCCKQYVLILVLFIKNLNAWSKIYEIKRRIMTIIFYCLIWIWCLGERIESAKKLPLHQVFDRLNFETLSSLYIIMLILVDGFLLGWLLFFFSGFDNNNDNNNNYIFANLLFALPLYNF